MKRIFLSVIVATFMLGSAHAARPYPAEVQPYMRPVDKVLAAMAQHNPNLLANAYTPDAVIIDDQEPYRWSGSNAADTWLSVLTTVGRLHHARFMLSAPMQVWHTPDTAYVSIIGRLSPRVGYLDYATMTFSLRKVGGDWKIETQTWTAIPPPKV